jgi:hypothetical protein
LCGQAAAFRHVLAEAAAAFAEPLREASLDPERATVARFLRARKGDVRAAVDQYLEAEAWCCKEGVDSILVPDEDEPVGWAGAGRCRPHRPLGPTVLCTGVPVASPALQPGL